MAVNSEVMYPPELAESQLSSSSTRPVMASSMPLYTEVCTIKERETMKMTRMTNTMPMVVEEPPAGNAFGKHGAPSLS